jgi:uncharacterized protein (TIGR03000 family)
MYSIVLMAALSTSATDPACCWGRGCGCAGYSHGCGGGYCGGGYGCGGYGCGGGWGASCCGYGYSYGYCGGCGGGYGYCMGGGYINYAPAYIAPPPGGGAMPAKPDGTKPEAIPAPKAKPAPGKDDKETSLNNQARLIVSVPADAKLFIDGQPMKTSASQRTFRTPKLDPRLTYYYDVRAEVVRDGKTITRTQRVILRAGDAVNATFDLPAVAAEATASK